jgi:hypothetical protein
MHRKKLLDEDLLMNTFVLGVCNYWAAARPYVENARQTYRSTNLYTEWENLAAAFDARLGASSLIGRSPDALKAFLELEVRRGEHEGV